MIERYLNLEGPFIVSDEAGEILYEFPSLNSFTWDILKKAYQLNVVTKKLSPVFAFLAPGTVTRGLTYGQQKEIFEKWEEHSGITFSQIGAFIDIVENKSVDLMADLSALTNLKSISELLQLKPFEGWKIVEAISGKAPRQSWIVANVNDWAIPFSHESVVEQILFMIANSTANFMAKNPKALPTPSPQLKTDNSNEELDTAEYEGLSIAEMERQIANWRRTGSVNPEEEKEHEDGS